MTVTVLLDNGLLVVFSILFILFIHRNFESLNLISFIRSKFSSDIRLNQSTFSPEHACASFASYALLSERELDAKGTSYATLSRRNRRVASRIGYDRKLSRAREVIHLNAIVTDGIVSLVEDEMPWITLHYKRPSARSVVNSGGLSLVREVIKHFVRDWSEEGKKERSAIFEPILDVLRHVRNEERPDTKILVPGCGLGRLAWEISQLGFDTTANDISPYMLLALRFLLSPKHTYTVNQHTVRPYAHWFSHQRSNASLFRVISFPDVVPRHLPTFRIVQDNFMSLSSPKLSGDSKTCEFGYDYIVTLFFIDTSLDVISTLEKIRDLLRPGGMWINLGPLLWTGGAQAKLELSLEEVLSVVEEVGFRVLTDLPHIMRRTVECEYTADQDAMMTWIYKAEFWVAQKV